MPESFVRFKEIKQAVSIVQILERYSLIGTLTKRGESLVGPCPVHKGYNARHFHVSPAKNCWNCFGGCGGGNIFDFVAKKEGVSVRDAALLIADWFGLMSSAEAPRAGIPEESERATIAPDPEPSAAAELAENPALPFALKSLDATHPAFRAHGITPATAATFGAGYCSKGMMRGRIALPIHSGRGELVAYAGLAVEDETERYKYPPTFGRDLEIYNAHRALAVAGRELVIAAELIDVLRLYQLGVIRAVALFGSGLSAAQERAVREALADDDLVTVLCRPEEARDELAGRLSRSCCVRQVELEQLDDGLGRFFEAAPAGAVAGGDRHG